MKKICKYIEDIRVELGRAKDLVIKSQPNAALIDKEIDAIDDCLTAIDSLADDAKERIAELEGETNDLEEKLQEFEEEGVDSNLDIDPISGISDVDTMSGRIQYATNNLIDENILDEFADCIAQVRPSVLLEYIANIKLKESVKTNI